MVDHDSNLENEKENTANGKISAYDHNMERYNEDECPVFEQIEVPKGQLISKCSFGIFNSPKKPTKFLSGFLP